MKNLDCNQIMIFINLEIIKEWKIISIFKIFLQFDEATWCNHGF